MSARKYLNETGLASLWAKIVNKINAMGDTCVKKVGDTITGTLFFATSASIQVKTNIDKDVIPTEDIAKALYNFRDKNNNFIGVLQARQYKDVGNIATIIGATREVNGTDYFNHLTLSLTPAGEKVVQVSDKPSWRSALGLATVASSGNYNDLTNKPDTNIYNNYSGAVQYYIGDVVYYGGFVYKCIVTPLSPGYSPTGSPQYWTVTNISAQIGDVQRCMSIRETFPANTSIVSAIGSIITKYGKNSLMGGFIITGYGFISFSLSFSDNGQGGGYVVANNKGTGGNTPALYIIQYVNGVVTLGYT